MRNLKGNTFSFTPHVCYFSYNPWIAASEDLSLTTPFATQMRREETQPQEHQHPCPHLEFCESSSPLSKNHKKPEVNKKIQTC